MTTKIIAAAFLLVFVVGIFFGWRNTNDERIFTRAALSFVIAWCLVGIVAATIVLCGVVVMAVVILVY